VSVVEISLATVMLMCLLIQHHHKLCT